MSESKCKCGLATKLVGDGCQHCNPEYLKDHMSDTPNCPHCGADHNWKLRSSDCYEREIAKLKEQLAASKRLLKKRRALIPLNAKLKKNL